MSRRGMNSQYYSYHSPSGHGSSGEEGFHSPRPQYQSSPRPYGHMNHRGYPCRQNHGNFHNHSNMSPIPPTSPQSGEVNHSRSFPINSPYHNPGLKFQGKRGRGRGGRFHSGGDSPHNRWEGNRSHGSGSDNIRDYFHPSMLEDPWEKLVPVPIPQVAQRT